MSRTGSVDTDPASRPIETALSRSIAILDRAVFGSWVRLEYPVWAPYPLDSLRRASNAASTNGATSMP